MAKTAYVGIDNINRNISSMYVGILTELPIYEGEIVTSNITADNISDFFTVTNDSYYFVGNGSTFTSNNAGVSSSTATTTLTALVDMSEISFNYSVSSEAGYDKAIITVAGSIIANGISGTGSSSWSGSLNAGQTIEFKYIKDAGVDSGDDITTFSNMVVTIDSRVQIGTEIKSVARTVKKAYVGDENGIARLFFEALNLIDFKYTRNDDGTYLLTDWKGTLNGNPSTELVIPDDPRIIL